MSGYGIAAMLLLAAMLWGTPAAAGDAPLEERVEHRFAENGDVRIHYAVMGSGPLVVMVHGFPDFWYSWRYQMPALAEHYRVAAMDLRGYNKSGKPSGQENYGVDKLIGDVAAVISAEGAGKAVVVGHDWGGYISWWLAAFRPELVDKLIICNLPHPKGISRELANNPEQQANSAYARAFQQPDAHKVVDINFLASLVAKDDAALRARYVEAFEQSDLEAMLAYYKENYPKPPYEEDARGVPPIQAPVLLFHGLDDQALHPSGLNNTWEWVANRLTMVTIPGADHWVHHDAADYVTGVMLDWLKRH